jgi:hypothetical protein
VAVISRQPLPRRTRLSEEQGGERERQREREREREDAGVRGGGGDSVSARVAVMASAVGMVLVGWSDGCVSSRLLTKPLCYTN